MNEIWKNIEGYNGDYQVSNLGRVKSYKYKAPRILKNVLNEYGYFRLNLSKNGKIKLYRVHRLVAETFLPNPENKPCINHKNGIKTDNRVENLEWCTYSENHIHAYKNGLMTVSDISGEKSGGSKLTNEKVNNIRQLYNSGDHTQWDLANKYNVHQSTIERIVNKKTWVNV